MDFFVSKPLINIKNGVAGAKPPTGSRGGSPTFSPARTPGVYAQRLCTMQSQQSIHSLSPRERGLGIGIENSHYLIKNRLFLQAGAVFKKTNGSFQLYQKTF